MRSAEGDPDGMGPGGPDCMRMEELQLDDVEADEDRVVEEDDDE